MLHSHGFHVDEDNSITFKTSIDLKLQQNRAWKLKKKSLLVQTSFHEGKFLCLCGYIIIKFFGSKSPLLLQFSCWWSQLYNFNFKTLTSLEIQQNSAWKLEKITLNTFATMNWQLVAASMCKNLLISLMLHSYTYCFFLQIILGSLAYYV